MGNTQVKIDLKEVQDDLKQLRDDLNKLTDANTQVRDELREVQDDLKQLSDDLTDANTQVQENLREFRDANKIELQEIRDELKESRRERAFEKGRYFVRMDALWNADQEKFYGSEAELRAFRTEGAVVEWYRQLQSVPVPKQKSQKSDFPDEPMFPGSAVSNNDMPSLAHLLPKDRSCTMFYGNAIALITGYSCNDKETNCLASDSLRHLIEGSSKTKQAGIKDLTSNYLHLPGNHASYFDHLSKGNGLIITPIWDPAVEWRPGQPYEILVVALQASTYLWMGLDPMDMDEKKWLGEASGYDLEAATNFLKLVVKALADQLVSKKGDAFFEKANEMEQNELELLFSNQTSNSQASERSGSGSETPPRPSLSVPRSTSMGSSTNGEKPTKKVEEFKRKLKDLQNVREKLSKAGTVAVPTINTETDGANNSRRVLKIDFAKYFASEPKSIPDPFLLALKAATSWSYLQDTKLLPACRCALVSEDEPVCSISSIKEILCTLPCDDDDDDCSVLSEEKPSVSAAVVSPDSATMDKMNFW